MMTYAQEMSEKIMNATPAQFAEMLEELEMEVYNDLTLQAKGKVDAALKESGMEENEERYGV